MHRVSKALVISISNKSIRRHSSQPTQSSGRRTCEIPCRSWYVANSHPNVPSRVPAKIRKYQMEIKGVFERLLRNLEACLRVSQASQEEKELRQAFSDFWPKTAVYLLSCRFSTAMHHRGLNQYITEVVLANSRRKARKLDLNSALAQLKVSMLSSALCGDSPDFTLTTCPVAEVSAGDCGRAQSRTLRRVQAARDDLVRSPPARPDVHVDEPLSRPCHSRAHEPPATDLPSRLDRCHVLFCMTLSKTEQLTVAN